jgi:hypothetical protein
VSDGVYQVDSSYSAGDPVVLELGDHRHSLTDVLGPLELGETKVGLNLHWRAQARGDQRERIRRSERITAYLKLVLIVERDIRHSC